jgi:hypothetical protein
MIDQLLVEIGFVYGIKSLDLIKVGVAKNIDNRINDMRALNPHGCELVFYRKVFAPYAFEKRMHELLAEKAVGREWFRVSVAEVREAASKARLVSMRAKTRSDRWRRQQSEILAHG